MVDLQSSRSLAPISVKMCIQLQKGSGWKENTLKQSAPKIQQNRKNNNPIKCGRRSNKLTNNINNISNARTYNGEID